MGIDFRRIRINRFKEQHCKNKECAPCTHSAMIDTPEYFKCSHEEHPDILDIKRAEAKANEVHVEAFEDFFTDSDQKPKTFDKVVTIENEDRGGIISFGWPCSYYIEDLLKRYPLDTNLCIDASGLNHSGRAVYISMNDINRLLEPHSV